MNVFVHELRSNIKGALLWAVGLALAGAAVVAITPILLKDVQVLVDLLRGFPQPVLDALGVTADSLNGFNGFYSVEFVFIALCAAMEGLIFGIASASVEGARKTGDFLFTKPLSRRRILLAKYLATCAQMLVSCALYMAVTWPLALTCVKDLDHRVFALLSGSFCLTQWLCASIGFCVGCCARRIKAPNAVGLGLGGLFFALQMVENLPGDVSIAFLTPLAYLNPGYIAAHRAYDMPYLVALPVLSIALVCLGMWRYGARDITT